MADQQQYHPSVQETGKKLDTFCQRLTEAITDLDGLKKTVSNLKAADPE